MLYRSLFRFCRPAFQSKNLVPKQIKWHHRNGKLCIEGEYPDPHLFYVSPSMGFEAMLQIYDKFNIDFEFPDGVNVSTGIVDFLEHEKKAKSVKINLNGSPYFLRNKASYPYYQSFKNVLEQPNSIYNSIQQKVYQEMPLRQAVVLTHIEKTFMAQLRKLPGQTIIDQTKRAQLMVKVMEYYSNDSILKLWNLKIEELRFDIIIQKLNEEIESLQVGSEVKYQIVKKMIAMVSVTHILAFGYAIFFVDWLGWDIIQPLTYTIGIFGSISAMIFYLIHHQDSSGETVKEIFKRYIMKNSQRIRLEDKLAKRDFFTNERERIRDRMKIFRMRVDYGYFRDINDLQRGQLRNNI